MTEKKQRLFMWADELIAAVDLAHARRLLRESYEPKDIRRYEIKPITGMVQYCDQEFNVVGEVDAEDCGSVWKSCIVPDNS